LASKYTEPATMRQVPVATRACKNDFPTHLS
jgi:hypothetical protein